MAQPKSPLRQAHVLAALKAARDAGLTVTSYRVDPVTGEIVINIDTSAIPEASDRDVASWDRAIRKDLGRN